MAGTRNIPLGLLSLLTGVAVSLAIGATLLLYQDSLRLTRERLLQIAGAKAALIRSAAVLAAAPVTPEALASGNSPLRRAIASTLPGFPPFGKTGVALVGFRDDRVVRFIPAMEDPPPAALAPVPWQAALGRPIGQALLGNRGTLIATDHRGVAVLAAYRPVPETPLGVVVRLELAELRDPFLRWGALASLLAGVLVVAGAWFLGRVLWPLLAELEQSRDMNRAIVDTVREGILTVDGGGIVREFNPGARALFGYAEAELSGMPAARLFPETDPGMWQRRDVLGLPASFGRGTPMLVTTGQARGGGRFPVELSLSHIALDDRWFITVIARDITERIQAEDDLRRSQHLLKTIIDAIPNPIWMKDRQRRYQMVNRTWLRRFGHPAGEVLNRRLDDLDAVDGESVRLAAEVEQRVLDTGQGHEVSERNVIMASGREEWERVIRAPIRDQDGRVAGLVGWAEDITVRKEAQISSEKHLRRMQLLQKVAIAANEADSIEEALRVCLEEVCTLMEWPLGHAYLTSQDTPAVLEHTPVWQVSDPQRFRPFIEVTEKIVFKAGEGLPGKILATARPYWMARPGHRLRFPRKRMIDRFGLHSAFGFPVIVGHEVAGVLEFFSEQEHPRDEDLMEVMTHVGTQLGRVIERSRAEHRLRESEHRLSRMLDLAMDAVITLDEHLRIVLFNRGAEHIFGHSREDMYGRTLDCLIPPAFREAHAVHMQRFQGSPEVSRTMNQRGEIAGLRADGEEFPAEASISKFEVKGNRYLTVLLRDITQRKEAEKALESQRKMLETVFNTIPYPLSVKDREGRYTMVNPAWTQAYGIDVAGVVSLRPDDLPNRPPQERSEIVTLDRQALKSHGRLVVADVTRNHVSRGTREYRSHKLGYQDSFGHTAGVVTLNVDTTESNRRERELRASEERFRNLIENAPQGIAIQQKGRPVFVNPSFARIFGYDSPHQVLAIPYLSELVAPEHLQPLQATVERVLESGSSEPETFQVDCIRKDGSTVPIEGYLQVAHWRGRSALLYTVVDVSERIDLENQLRHAQKMEAVGQLAGGVAHDFNNILQIIRGYTELAQKHLAQPDKGRVYLERVLKAADGATALARRLLAFSRRDVLSSRALDINGLISDLMQMMQRLIGEDIDLAVDFAPHLPSIEGDPALLEQLLLNLIVNARDAMPGGGRLRIRTSRLVSNHEFVQKHGGEHGQSYIAVEITDSGTGISQEQLEHIFEPFFTTKDPGKGTGLGLFMVYGIVQQHNGRVDVDSELGKGTTFFLYLPVSEKTAQPEVLKAAKEESGGRETILVAEDEGEVLELVVNLLTGKGYGVITARDGEEAVSVFRDHAEAIDLAILDVVMPKMGGREVFTALRAQNPNLPVLFSTGYTAETIDNDFVTQHQANLIRKPYSPGDLYRAVRNSLDRAVPPAGHSSPIRTISGR